MLGENKKMKICVATNKGGLEDTVSAVFGRCATFTFVEVEGKEIKNTDVVEHLSANGYGGPGIQALQLIVNKGANVVIAGSYGPNTLVVLREAGVKVVSSPRISVKDAVMKYLNGELEEVSRATGHAHEGMGYGRGMGRGFGRGHGYGMGYGRGR